MRRVVIGGRPRRSRHQCPVADQFRQPFAPVDADPQLGCLRALSQQRDLVDRQSLGRGAIHADRAHPQRVEDGFLGTVQAQVQIVLGVIVHKKADGAPVHSVNRPRQRPAGIQRLQHEPVTAQRHDHIGISHCHLAIAVAQPVQSRARGGRVAGNKGDPAGRVHRALLEWSV